MNRLVTDIDQEERMQAADMGGGGGTQAC